MYTNLSKVECKKRILSNSHTECAINDRIIKTSINLSFSADTYFWSYVKLKTISKNNPNIKTIVLNFGYRSLVRNTDEWVDGDAIIKSKLARYFHLINIYGFI